MSLHFQFSRGQLHAMWCRKWNLEELVLSNEYDVIVGFGIKLMRGVRGFGGVSRRVESGREIRRGTVKA